jgi:hypothetical protein
MGSSGNPGPSPGSKTVATSRRRQAGASRGSRSRAGSRQAASPGSNRGTGRVRVASPGKRRVAGASRRPSQRQNLPSRRGSRCGRGQRAAGSVARSRQPSLLILAGSHCSSLPCHSSSVAPCGFTRGCLYECVKAATWQLRALPNRDANEGSGAGQPPATHHRQSRQDRGETRHGRIGGK